MQFALSAIPDILFANNALQDIASHARGLCENKAALVVMDSFLARSGLGTSVIERLAAGGISADLFSDFVGEPKLEHLRAAGNLAAGKSLIIGIGGGSALDIAKIAACTGASGADPMFYALAANPLPKDPLRKIMVPTTAGTGSEASATNIFSGPEGGKLWIWGSETKSDLVILDPTLTVSLPGNLTAWCGMDAFIHAFEASTNRNTHAAAKLFGHEAMRLISDNLECAVLNPGDIEARGNVLLGSCYAGIAIDNCGTAMAHNISHALAGLAPIHHGLATALAFEVSLPWLVQASTADMNEAAHAIGKENAADLPHHISALMDRVGFDRRLPAAFSGFSVDQLADEMRKPENAPMLRATIREAADSDIVSIAAAMMNLEKETV